MTQAAELPSPQVMQEALARERRSRWRNDCAALAFVAPALLFVGLFLLLPVLANVCLSFTRWQRFGGIDQFAGLANYRRLASVPYFREAVANTAIWVGSAVVLPLAIGLGLALAVRGVRLQETLKSVFFLPKVLAPTAVGAIWYYMYTPDGVLNTVAAVLGASGAATGWLYDARTVTPAVVATFVWQSLGVNMVLLLLGLAALPRDPIEAARLDGASPLQTFVHIVLPLMLPTILVVTMLNVAAGLTTFDLLWVMASGFPGKRSLSLAVYMYFESFAKGAWAYGAAIAVALSAMVISVSAVLAWLQARVERRLR